MLLKNGSENYGQLIKKYFYQFFIVFNYFHLYFLLFSGVSKGIRKILRILRVTYRMFLFMIVVNFDSLRNMFFYKSVSVILCIASLKSKFNYANVNLYTGFHGLKHESICFRDNAYEITLFSLNIKKLEKERYFSRYFKINSAI